MCHFIFIWFRSLDFAVAFDFENIIIVFLEIRMHSFASWSESKSNYDSIAASLNRNSRHRIGFLELSAAGFKFYVKRQWAPAISGTRQQTPRTGCIRTNDAAKKPLETECRASGESWHLCSRQFNRFYSRKLNKPVVPSSAKGVEYELRGGPVVPNAKIMYHSIRISSLQKLIYLFTECEAASICIDGTDGPPQTRLGERHECVAHTHQPPGIRFLGENFVCCMLACTSECLARFTGISHYRCADGCMLLTLQIQKSHILTAHRWFHECITCSECTIPSRAPANRPQCRRRHMSFHFSNGRRFEHRQQFALHSHFTWIEQWPSENSIKAFSQGADRADDYILSTQMRPVCERTTSVHRIWLHRAEDDDAWTHAYTIRASERTFV